MSRAGVLFIFLGVIVVAVVVGLVVLSGSVAPPQHQVQGTVPDDRLPK